MAKLKPKAHRKAMYTAYKTASKWKINRIARLQRALKRNPENAEQIQRAIANVSYRRGTPKTKVWSHSEKALAQLFRKASGSGAHALVSSNPENFLKAVEALPKGKPAPAARGSIYSIAARLKG